MERFVLFLCAKSHFFNNFSTKWRISLKKGIQISCSLQKIFYI